MIVAYTVGTNLVYAPIQEFGGTIHAKSGGYLVFQTDDGEWHSVRSVNIPARPYMRPGFDESHLAAVAAIGKVFRELVLEAVL